MVSVDDVTVKLFSGQGVPIQRFMSIPLRVSELILRNSGTFLKFNVKPGKIRFFSILVP